VWLLDTQDKHKTEGRIHYVKCRPWISLCGQDFNTTMFEKMKNSVLQYIMDYPGVTMVSEVIQWSHKNTCLVYVASNRTSFHWCVTDECFTRCFRGLDHLNLMSYDNILIVL